MERVETIKQKSYSIERNTIRDRSLRIRNKYNPIKAYLDKLYRETHNQAIYDNVYDFIDDNYQIKSQFRMFGTIMRELHMIINWRTDFKFVKKVRTKVFRYNTYKPPAILDRYRCNKYNIQFFKHSRNFKRKLY